jgi:hypothetical protein
LRDKRVSIYWRIQQHITPCNSQFPFSYVHELQIKVQIHDATYLISTTVFRSPGQRPSELFPSLGIRRRPFLRSSVRPLYVVSFHIKCFPLWNHWTTLRQTWGLPWVGSFLNCVWQPWSWSCGVGFTTTRAISGTLVSSTNKTHCHDIIEILLKVALTP